jgi:organic radical activating enzyme
MGLSLSNLVIEVTRKCNMFCGHCLRGDMENVDLQEKYIDSLLNQVTYINDVTFTGGEPSLNVPIMEYFLTQCKKREIGIGGFYIATNGLKVNEDFVMFCLRLFSYCDEKSECNVHVSNDYYHQLEGSYTTELLDGLSFFGRKFDKEGFNYNNDETVIRQGRGEEFGHSELDCPNIETKDDLRDTNIYLNCNGDVVNGCDLSYKNQNDYVLCHVDNLTEFVNGLED